MQKENLVAHAARIGDYLLEGLRAMQQRHPDQIVEVRGEGMMIGIEYAQPVKEMRRRLVEEQHVFTGAASTHIIRLLPPLTLTEEEAAEALQCLESVL